MKLATFTSNTFTRVGVVIEDRIILTTGTASRVNHLLQPGDVVRCEVDGIGHIENSVIAQA